ncbi:MAG: hypothetical protein ACXAC7_21545 [Candidatus Hodarchaeales archaeon]
MEDADDPFKKLVDTFVSLENDNRALCLLSVYLGQRADQNTIAGIGEIYQKFLGEEVTSGRVRGQLTGLVKAELIGRETEKLIGSTKVSFHQINLLGTIGLLWICVMSNLIENPVELPWDQTKFTDVLYERNDQNFVRFLLETFLSKIPAPAKIIKGIQGGRDIKKIRVKPLVLNVPKTLGGQGKTFKVFEEILWDYMGLTNIGLTKSQLLDSLGGDPIGRHLNKLKQILSVEKIGKIDYYRLSTRGIFLLPIIVLLIRALTTDLIHELSDIIYDNKDSKINPWIILTSQSNKFFRKLYSVEEKL